MRPADDGHTADARHAADGGHAADAADARHAADAAHGRLTHATALASGIDESLRQVEAALAASGSSAAAPFASADQGNYSVEQLRAYLRASASRRRRGSTS